MAREFITTQTFFINCYSKGDKDSLADDEVEQAQILWRKILSLPEANKRQAVGYIDGLLQVSDN